MTTAGFTSRYYSAQDGLRLHFRDYGDPLAPGVPILCLPGLVRHSIDFDSFAQRHCARHRVLAPDLRGRGLKAVLETVQVGGRQVSRVLLGPYSNQQAAEGARSSIILSGFADARSFER